MFGLDFFELVVIFVVALVVLGPTRLPGVARKVGRWIGKARGMARDFRQQLENEVTLDELNKLTEKQSRRDPPPPPPADSAPPRAEAAAMADAPAASDSPLAGSGYPYGAPADAGAAEPAAAGPAPQPGDDTYSHAHAAGDAPQAWSPAEEIEPLPAQPAAEHETAVAADATDSTLKPDPSAPAPGKAHA